MADESAALAASALHMLSLLTHARRLALFKCDDSGLRLAASRGVDQEALDGVARLWSHARNAILSGAPFQRWEGPRPFVCLPCLDQANVVGLLYVETSRPTISAMRGQLATFAAILGRTLAQQAVRVNESAPRCFVPDAREPRALELLLERNEWNVSRVAWILGVTRMTIYSRLRRAGTLRLRAPKTSRRAPTAAAPSPTTGTS